MVDFIKLMQDTVQKTQKQLDFEQGSGDWLSPLVKHWHRTGSSYTCDPPVTNTDVDFLVFVDDISTYQGELWDWGMCLSDDPGAQEAYKNDPEFMQTWVSLRRDNINLIISHDWNWYCRAIAATELCKALNLMDKKHRCMAFRHVRDGVLGAEIDLNEFRPE